MHSLQNNQIPEEIGEIIPKDYLWINVTTGMSGSVIYFLKHPDSYGENYYLKINIQSVMNNIEEEYFRIKWLENKISVPNAIKYFQKLGKEYLLLSEIHGTPSFQLGKQLDEKKIVSLLANGLKKIHSLKTSDCPFDQSLDKQLSKVKKICQDNLVNIENLEDENKSKTFEELYNELLTKRNFKEDLVFTHGDYCLPNILIDNGKITGFIDLGRAGIADRYQDLALCARSILLNFKDKRLIPIFFKKYGVKKIDQSKLAYYKLLDEFF